MDVVITLKRIHRITLPSQNAVCVIWREMTLTPELYASIMHIDTYMRTTLNIDDELLKEATRLSGIDEKTAVVRAGLEALIARESARRLAALGGSEPGLRQIHRRHSQLRGVRAHVG